MDVGMIKVGITSQPSLQYVNPKRRSDAAIARFPGSEYYAGFSERFAYHAICELGLDCNDIVLDSWNGSGTTTSVAYQLGLRSIGIDINPVMAVIATARVASSHDIQRAGRKASEVCRTFQLVSPSMSGEGLVAWFSPDTAAAFRQIANLVRRESLAQDDLAYLTPSDALLFLALFQVAKQAVGRFRTSNPTWIRSARSSSEHVELPPSKVLAAFDQTVYEFLEKTTRVRRDVPSANELPRLLVASAEQLPIEDGSVSAVLTSPPYCTRIDYAVATKVEYAVLGMSLNVSFRCMRDAMLGTPTISSAAEIEPATDWGPTCDFILNQVRSHESKASSTYYLKTYCQYFHQLFASMKELVRVLAPGGTVTMVVQDSHYKEVRVDLASVIQEMGEALGAGLTARQDFPTSATMRWVNSKSQRYRAGGATVETVLKLSKE